VSYKNLGSNTAWYPHYKVSWAVESEMMALNIIYLNTTFRLDTCTCMRVGRMVFLVLTEKVKMSKWDISMRSPLYGSMLKGIVNCITIAPTLLCSTTM